jgi:hypothetical protein
VLGLFRRGRIDEATLDQQLDPVDVETADPQSDIEALRRELSAGDRTAQLQSAEEPLDFLHQYSDRVVVNVPEQQAAARPPRL